MTRRSYRGAGAAGGGRGGGVRSADPGVIRSRRCSGRPGNPAVRIRRVRARPRRPLLHRRQVGRRDALGGVDGDHGVGLVEGRSAEEASLSLGAADDQQQLQIEALAAGHRAPSAALPTAAPPALGYRRWARGSPWGRRAASDSGGREESPSACTPRLAGVVALRGARPRGGVADPETASAGRTASGPVTAASRRAVVAESSVAPPYDEVSREDTALKHPQLFPDCSTSLYPGSGQAHDSSTTHPSGTAAGSRHRVWRP
jgi:hypothetical protein